MSHLDRDETNRVADCVPDIVGATQQRHLQEFEQRLEAERAEQRALRQAAGDESMTATELAAILGGATDEAKELKKLDEQLDKMERDVAEVLASKERKDEPLEGRFPPPPTTSKR